MKLARASVVVGAVVIGAGVVLGACGSDDRAPALTTPTCSTPGCGGVGGGSSSHDAGDAQHWAGARAEVNGTMFAMVQPTFWPIRNKEPDLAHPAQVVLWAYGEEHIADYDPANGFVMTQVPVGSFYVIARDLDDGNGIISTAIGAAVNAGTNTYPVPALLRSDIETVYQAAGQAVDATRAQILVTVSDCQGMSMLSNVTFNVPSNADAVIVEDGTGSWTAANQAPTGPNGIAWVVNVPADPPPGVQVPLEYTYDGVTNRDLSYRVMAGTVTRVHIFDGCTRP